MINAGRWILVVVLGLYGLLQLFGGIAFLTGAVKVPTEEIQVPPGQEQVVFTVAVSVAFLSGALLLLAAWGILSWRPWARIISIAVAVFVLLSIVVMSFQRTLPVSAYVALAITIAVLAWLFNSRVANAFKTRGQQQ